MFQTGVQLNTHVRKSDSDQAILIDSKAALERFVLDYGDLNNLLAPALARYDDAFFAQRALVAVTRSESSGSITHTAQRIERQGSALNVYFTRHLPGIGTSDMAYWVFALEVARDDIAGISAHGVQAHWANAQ